MRENSSAENAPIPELPDDLSLFADQLGSFKPRSIRVDRDQLMFAAGEASARLAIQTEVSASRRSLRIWQSAAVVLMTVSAGLGSVVMWQPDAKPRLAFIGRQQSPSPSVDSPDSVLNDQRPPAVAQQSSPSIPISIPIDVHVEREAGSTESSFNAFEGLRSRQLQIAQLLDSRERLDDSLAGIDAHESSSGRIQQRPMLTPRSLMMGEQSRIWINRLIEEPQL